MTAKKSARVVVRRVQAKSVVIQITGDESGVRTTVSAEGSPAAHAAARALARSMSEAVARGVSASPQLSRGVVWCHTCGRTQRVDPVHCLQHGWPKCCGSTMSIDSPAERRTRR